MGTKKDTFVEFDLGRLSKSDLTLMRSVRQQALLLEAGLQKSLGTTLGPVIGRRGITAWEQLTCVGFNPERSLLEATITLKQSNGYSGGPCTPGSTEYVRFFVDWEDGGGWQEVGLASVQVFDVSDDPDGPQHPLEYMVSLTLNAEDKRRVCRVAVTPKVRAILSWSSLPPTDATQLPLFGNRVDTRILLKPLTRLSIFDVIETGVLKAGTADLLEAVDVSSFITFKPKALTAEALTAEYVQKAVSPKRIAHTVFKPLLSPAQLTINANDFGKISILDVAKNFNVDVFKLFDELEKEQANVDFEQLTCVGLDPDRDALGGIVRLKQSAGYSGSLCRAGSQEHVAFWADWDNDGTFEEYLGTASVTVHDVDLPDGDPLDFAVRLQTDAFLRHLQSCKTPNVVRIRAVLSWDTPPSTTDPDDLQTWGNRIDVLVLLRAGSVVSGMVDHRIYYVGSVPIQQISTTTHLAYPSAIGSAGPGNNRPWGGYITIAGRLLNAPTPAYYKLTYKRHGTSDTPQPISTAETFTIDNPGGGPLNPSLNVDRTAVNGWFPYMNDINNLLARWRTGPALADGKYDITFSWTAADPATNPVGIELQTITIETCNLAFEKNPFALPTLDFSKTFDHVIEEPTGGCRTYRRSASEIITGHARAVHPYFGSYDLRIEPTSMSGATVPVPRSGAYPTFPTGIADRTWTINSNTLPPCGYTVTLIAWDRTIVNDNNATHWDAKAVGFSVIP